MYYLGLDYSTQQLKALVVDTNAKIIVKENITYDSDLKHYGTTHGVFKQDNGKVCAPSIMWIEATDKLLERLKLIIDLSKITAICGSAQQHTTMFWGKNANNKLSNLDPLTSLSNQLKTSFSKPLSPTWMDSSTDKECSMLEDFVGGKSQIQSRIGSSLANRFSGPQILKALTDDRDLDDLTEHITLVSNGMCSVFAGKIVGMDVSDAAGTGLQKCGSLNWDINICSFISPNLVSKLGQITKSSCVVSNLNKYFVERYQMSSECKIVPFTGDNPSSVVGMLMNINDKCLSLGTSDTLFACLPHSPNVKEDIPIFVFPHPLYPEIFVTLLCYKNGSQTREFVSEQYSNANWETFTNLLNQSPPGNNGTFGLFYDLAEIIPPGIIGRYFKTNDVPNGKNVSEQDLDKSSLIRALIESQLLAKFFHFSEINSSNSELIGKMYVTGGASLNMSILQIAADIFNQPIFSIDTANSAAIGSIYRAVAAVENELTFSEFKKQLHYCKHVCDPQNNEVYNEVKSKFIEFIRGICLKN